MGNKHFLSFRECAGLDKVNRDYNVTIVAAAAGGDFATGGSWVGGVAPGVGDDAQLSAASGNISIGAGAVCRSLDCTGYTGTLSGTGTLTIGDATAGLSSIALKFVAGMTVSGPPVFSFVSTSATVQTIDFASKTTGAVSFNAASNGSWQYVGGHVTGSSTQVTFTKGTLDLNGQTVSWGVFDTANSNVRSLTLGAANITITNGGNVWVISTQTNLTFSAGSSTITLSGTNATFNGGSLTYGTVNMTGAGTATITGSATFSTLTRTGTAVKADNLTLSNSITVTSVFTLTGNSSVNRILIQSSILGTVRSISTAGATVTATATDFMDINFPTAKDFSGQTDIGDCGGNSGITFPASVTQTLNNAGSANWSLNGWTTRVPLPQDDVIVTGAAPSIVSDMPRLGRSMDFSGQTGAGTWAFSTTTNSIFGSLTLRSGLVTSGTQGFFFRGRGSYIIQTFGVAFAPVGLNFFAPGGTYTLQDALNSNASSSALSIQNGTFNANGFNVTANTFSVSGTATRSVIMGSGTWTATSNGLVNFWNAGTTTSLTFSGASAVIALTSTSVQVRSFQGGGLSYGTLQYTVSGSTGELDIVGSNTFSAIQCSDASGTRTIAFTAGTNTVLSTGAGWQVNGRANNLLTLKSITGPAFTITCSSGTISSDFLDMTNCVGAGGSIPFYAGANSVDHGGNTNWLFQANPAGGGTLKSLPLLGAG